MRVPTRLPTLFRLARGPLPGRSVDTPVVAAYLVMLSAVAPLSIDMYLPSMPTMAVDLHTTEAVVQLGVTLFLVAFAGSQLFYGPASDRFGRRPIMLFGITLFVLGGGIALFAGSGPMLVGGRVLQGFGGGAGPAVAHAVVLDVYGRQRATRVIALMAIALPLAPAIAPALGGVLHDLFGWQAVFITLIVFGILLIILYQVLLPETHRRDPGRASGSILADYRELFTSRTYVSYASIMGLMFGGQLIFIAMSSFVMIDELGLSAGLFGVIFALIAVGLMSGAIASSRLVARHNPYTVVRLGALIAFTGSTAMVVFVLSGQAHVATLMAPMVIAAVGLGIARPPAQAGAIIPFPHIAGIASSMLVFTQFVLASGFVITYGALVPQGSTALALGVWAPILAGLVTILILRPGARPSTTPADTHSTPSTAT